MKISFVVIISIAIATPSFCQFSDFKSTDFKKADSIADLYSNFDLRYQKKLTQLLTTNLPTEVEKFRAIFKWITNNISYDVEMLREINKKEAELKNDRKKLEKWRQRISNQLQKRLVINKSAICQGYSSLLEAMCEFAGIQCKIIEGYGRTLSQRIGYGKVNHAWNTVNLKNKWYLCDVTWASGYVTNEFSDFNKHFNEDYFLSDPNLLLQIIIQRISRGYYLMINHHLKSF
jgi:transglutaminase/protease-like cytokinesis protein 3